jgi:UV DNA damage repair endonuclease
MNKIDSENLIEILQDIYQRLMIDADDVGMAYDEVLQYVEQFEMDEDMLYSFIKERVQEKSERDKGRNVMESLKRALRDPLS